MKEVNKLLIADDHSLIRKGLKQVLEAETAFTILEAENGEQALDIIRNDKPEIAILDIEMPEYTGFEIAQKVHKESTPIDIIFLTMFKDESMFNNAMDIGVKGYVLKENTVSEIVQCVKAVLSGEYYLSPAISQYLIRRNSGLMNEASDKHGINLLTDSEKKILKLVSDMKTNQEIAKHLSISSKTVKNHRNNICNKLGLTGTHALLKYAIQNESNLD
ncbi:MAG TPA: DNA-binding response regulator [Balneola sp.]|jgi:DNA-binding NarL/FixJ family response regulator|nr:DNA-binding response regulator [Bacteroidota bacterium]MAC05624.1 DNA-binding response regulator [Balneola sp.]MAO77341.1 DNA-binding response regulator [Balneola sp.]MBF65445.1 DNA-binding response regulator [Balneola sp.]HAH51341.1 DNA-binding response regulator [Balneola sp.]|tara:strand:- start:2206 stop:2859 length:654 start_codon:yes stop_codon:yes gene_type:complete